MKKILSILFCSFLLSASLSAEDVLPSDTYYKDNIAVNNVNSNSPTLRDDFDGPGEGGPGGTGEGDGEYVGGNNSPVGDAILPIVLAALSYGVFAYTKRKRVSKN